MRPLLTAFLVAAASLRGAGLQGPAVALPPPSSDPALSLSEAVDRALANNFGVAVDRLSALRSIDSVQVADSAFEECHNFIASRFRLARSRIILVMIKQRLSEFR